MLSGLTIGKVAKEAGMNPKTIRYYEEIGLLPRARRNGAGYRTYTAADLERLTLIRRARLLGLSLAETSELVDYALNGRCVVLESRLSVLLEERLAEIDRKIGDLTRLRSEMKKYRGGLQARMNSTASRSVPAAPAICRCIDCAGEPMSDAKTELLPQNWRLAGPADGRERRNPVKDKGKKGTQSSPPQQSCGCGCATVKK